MYRVRKYNIEDTHCFFIALFKYFYVSQPPLQLQKTILYLVKPKQPLMALALAKMKT